MTGHGLRVDLYRSRGVWRWRMWSSSYVIGQSSEGYVKQSAAIRNLETVTGGRFEKISSPDFPVPYGILYRDVDQRIPVRLVQP